MGMQVVEPPVGEVLWAALVDHQVVGLLEPAADVAVVGVVTEKKKFKEQLTRCTGYK